MCIFLTLIIWELHFKVQTSFEALNFMLLLSLSLHSSFSTLKLLSMASYGDELLLDSSSPWSGVFNHLSSFFIPLPLNFKKQMTPLMKKIQGLQAPHETTSLVLHQHCHFLPSAMPFASCVTICRKVTFLHIWWPARNISKY